MHWSSLAISRSSVPGYRRFHSRGSYPQDRGLARRRAGSVKPRPRRPCQACRCQTTAPRSKSHPGLNGSSTGRAPRADSDALPAVGRTRVADPTGQVVYHLTHPDHSTREAHRGIFVEQVVEPHQRVQSCRARGAQLSTASVKSTVPTVPPPTSVIASVHRRLSLPAQRALRQSPVSVQRRSGNARVSSVCVPARSATVLGTVDVDRPLDVVAQERRPQRRAQAADRADRGLIGAGSSNVKSSRAAPPNSSPIPGARKPVENDPRSASPASGRNTVLTL